MKKTIKISIVLLIIILIKLTSSFIINEIVIKDYNNSKYDSKLIKILYFVNFNQPYIAYYNNGNIFYKTYEFDKAISKYKDALRMHPPKRKACDIRINLSLAMIKNINSDDADTVYNELENAKQNLYNDKCANANDDNGNSKEAESLEEEIKKVQESIKASSNDKPNNDKQKRRNNNDNPDKNIEKKLKEIEKKGNKSRQGDLDKEKDMGNGSYYDGKKW